MSEPAANAEAAPATGRFAFLRYMDINPVLVKDVRQVARSWTVIGAVMLVMAVFYFAAVAFMLNAEMSGRPNYLGQELFAWVGIPLMIITFFFIPIYVFIRTTMERASINSDLLYITAMSPARIIRGKLISGVYIMVLFYSAAVPFMVFSYLLKGIDLPTISILIAVFAMLNIILIQGAITLATSPTHIVVKIIVAVFVGIPVTIYTMIEAISMLLWSGWLNDLKEMDFWTGFVPVMGLYVMDCLLVAGLLYQAAVAFITPSSANRSLAFRRYFTVMWLIFGVEFLIWGWLEGVDEIAAVFLIVTTVVVIVGMMLGIGGRDDLSVRVRKQVPKNPFARFFTFFFFNGTLSSLLWLLGIWASTMILIGTCNILWIEFQGSSSFIDDDPLITYLCPCLFILYSFAHALLAIWFQRRWMPRRSPHLASLLFILITIIPYLFTLVATVILGKYLSDGGYYGARIPVPGVMLDLFHVWVDHDSYRGNPLHFGYHFIAVMILIAGGLLLNLKWIQAQLTQFIPHEPPPKLETDA